jgi:hypothetical protein
MPPHSLQRFNCRCSNDFSSMQARLEALARLSDVCVRPCFGDEKSRFKNNEEGKTPFDQPNSRAAHRGSAACSAFNGQQHAYVFWVWYCVACMLAEARHDSRLAFWYTFSTCSLSLVRKRLRILDCRFEARAFVLPAD